MTDRDLKNPSPAPIAARRSAKGPAAQRRFTWSLVAAMAALALAIATGGLFYLRHQLAIVRADAYDSLTAIASLKAEEIAKWRRESIDGGYFLTGAPFVAKDAVDFLGNPGSADSRAEMLKVLNLIRAGGNYESVLLFDPTGNLRLATREMAATSAAAIGGSIVAALRSNGATMADLHRNKPSKSIYLEVLVPTFAPGAGPSVGAHRGPPVAVFALRLNPDTFLFPLIRTWPTRSETAETYLVRRDGDDVVYLNDLRHQRGTALELRLPLSSPLLPGAMAARGERGVVQGVDYRSAPVLAAFLPVPDSPWMLVAKVDQAEAYAPVRAEAWRTGIIMGLLLASVMLGAAILWRQRHASLLGRELALERERNTLEARLAAVTLHANDSILLIDGNGRITDANDRAVATYGYSLEELRTLPCGGLRPPGSSGTLNQQLAGLSSKNGAVFETLHRRKDGTIFPVEVSGRSLEIEGHQFSIGIYRDITERKRAEQAARDSEAQLSNALKIARLGPWEYDVLAGKVIFGDLFYAIVRTTAEREGGYTMSPQRYAERFVHPDDLAAFMAEIHRALETTEPNYGGQFEHRIIYGDGETGYLTVRFLNIMDDRGRTVRVFGVTQDITERRLAENRIRYLNRVYAVLSEINQSIVRERDMTALYECACRIAVEKGGFCLAWIGFADKGSNTLSVVARAGLDSGFIEKLPAALGGNSSGEAGPGEAWQAGGRVVCNNFQHHPRLARWREDSRRLGFHAFASIPFNRGAGVGTINLIAGENDFFVEEELRLLDELALDISFAGDVHESESVRRQAELRIREQVHAMDLAPIGIFTSNLPGAITYCNGTFAKLFGFARTEEVLGLSADDILSPSDSEAYKAVRNKAMATGMWQGELAVLIRGERRVVLDFTLSVLFDEAGQLKGRLGIFVDLTEKKQLEEQAMRAQRLENLGMLAAGIAHDFNNSLAPIIMAGPLLRPQISDPAGLRILDIVKQSSARGAALVRQMLSFARGTSDSKQLTQMRHVLQEVAAISQSSFPKSIRFEVRIPGDLWPVMADPTQMHQVFLNLCVNARDAMPEGGGITVAAENRILDADQASRIVGGKFGNFVAIGVSDTGTGIPPKVLEKIFEPFFTTKGEGKGTGLGLSTVRAIVSNHRGFLAVDTATGMANGHGTTFTVYLPAAAGESPESSVPAGDTARLGHGELVLLVDDEEPVLDMGAAILTEGGYRVITARDGADAAAVFVPRASEVRLLITDLDMPLIGGRDLALALHKMKATLPVVVMTGGGLQPDADLRKFANAMLAKPFEAKKLLETVHLVINQNGSAVPFPTET